MKTVKDRVQTSFREKGSKFIGYLFPTDSTKHFEQELQQIESKYPDASHHCYAWRINPNDIEEFAQDDGEPSGTAGFPILNKLKSYNTINCACVVVRYFGGTKLGKPGLIQSYGQSAQFCLNEAELLTLIPTYTFEITYPYEQQTKIDRLKNRFDLKEIEAQYLENVTLKIACRAKQADQFWASLQKLEHQGIEATKQDSSFVTI